MMRLDDIPALLAYSEQGNYRERDVFFELTRLTAREEVEAVLASLPEHWKVGFTTWLSAEFDNDIPADKFVMIDSAVGDVPEKHLIVDRIRAWLRTNKPPASPRAPTPGVSGEDETVLARMRANRDKRMQGYATHGREKPLPTDSPIFKKWESDPFPGETSSGDNHKNGSDEGEED